MTKTIMGKEQVRKAAQFAVYVNWGLHAQVVEIAKAQGKSKSNVVRTAIEEYVRKTLTEKEV